jgi:hypothetical protein
MNEKGKYWNRTQTEKSQCALIGFPKESLVKRLSLTGSSEPAQRAVYKLVEVLASAKAKRSEGLVREEAIEDDQVPTRRIAFLLAEPLRHGCRPKRFCRRS